MNETATIVISVFSGVVTNVLSDIHLASAATGINVVVVDFDSDPDAEGLYKMYDENKQFLPVY